LVFVHAWTPLHAGAGQGVGSIDLPIARERATSLPLVPGSSIKGCLRDALGALPPDEIFAIFGPEKISDEDGHAGALRVGDARLTLLPVRSLSATFVWVTCPFVLRRLTRDAGACAVANLPDITPVAATHAQTSAKTSVVTFKSNKTRLVLEELDLEVDAASEKTATAWANWFAKSLFPGDAAWQGEFEKRFAIVSDEVFTFLADFATEVNAHIRIHQEKGVVDRGALWYQECLPAESILSTCFHSEDSKKKGVVLNAEPILAKVTKVSSMQLGGKATTGLGVVKLTAVTGAKG
jgi:CRISPR-associated protein Cmr4